MKASSEERFDFSEASVNSVANTSVHRVFGGSTENASDVLAVEEPLEIRLGFPDGTHKAVSITMRTPGEDGELALGLIVDADRCRSAGLPRIDKWLRTDDNHTDKGPYFEDHWEVDSLASSDREFVAKGIEMRRFDLELVLAEFKSEASKAKSAATICFR